MINYLKRLVAMNGGKLSVQFIDKNVNFLKKFRKLHIDSAPFHMSKRVDQLLEEVEKMYIDKLEYGDRTRAMQRLRVPPLEEKQPQIVTFRLGLFVGKTSFFLSIFINELIIYLQECFVFYFQY